MFSHFSRLQTGALPFWMQARSFAVAPEVSWENHERSLHHFYEAEITVEAQPPYSLLDLKIDLATQILNSCDLCPHECHINRNAGEVGFCGADYRTALHWEGTLYGEERELVPSHETFISGCTMRCAFCYSHPHIENAFSGRLISPDELAGCVSQRHQEGALNWNVVGGEPTVHLPTILRTLRVLKVPQPLVWNSNLYASEQAMELLDGVADVYLGDVHFGNDACARRLAKAPRYFGTVTRAFERAVHSGADVVIRHLLMPDHLDCCARPAMEWAKKALPNVPFHLMFQYLPDYRARGDAVLGRPITPEEMERATQMAHEIGVRLYQNPARDGLEATPSAPPVAGAEFDIVVHPDGRVAFTRLTGEMLPLIQSLK